MAGALSLSLKLGRRRTSTNFNPIWSYPSDFRVGAQFQPNGMLFEVQFEARGLFYQAAIFNKTLFEVKKKYTKVQCESDFIVSERRNCRLWQSRTDD